MRMTTALSLAVILGISACASGARRPSSGNNNLQKSLLERCSDAQQRSEPTPAGCAPQQAQTTQQRRVLRPGAIEMPQMPSPMGMGGGGLATGGGIIR